MLALLASEFCSLSGCFDSIRAAGDIRASGIVTTEPIVKTIFRPTTIMTQGQCDCEKGSRDWRNWAPDHWVRHGQPLLAAFGTQIPQPNSAIVVVLAVE